jgi:hypothetical protein
MSEPKATERTICLFREQGGTLRTSEALRLGIHPRTFMPCGMPATWNHLCRRRQLRDADTQPSAKGPFPPRRAACPRLVCRASDFNCDLTHQALHWQEGQRGSIGRPARIPPKALTSPQVWVIMALSANANHLQIA